MPRFLVFHNTPEQGTQDQAFSGAQQVAALLGPGIEWLNSWWIPGEDPKLVCEWDAPDIETVLSCMGPISALFPVEDYHEVEWINPEWYL